MCSSDLDDAADGADGEYEAGDDTPIIHGPGSRAERDSARRLPHGGRQMSWWLQRHIHLRWKRSAGQGNDGARAGLGNKHAKNTRCTQVQGRRDEVKPLRPAVLVSIA